MLFDPRDRHPRVLVVNIGKESVCVESGKRMGILIDADEIEPPHPCHSDPQQRDIGEELHLAGWTGTDRLAREHTQRARSVRHRRGGWHLCIDSRGLDQRTKLVGPKLHPGLAAMLEHWRQQRAQLQPIVPLSSDIGYNSGSTEDSTPDLEGVEWWN
jgi:hypothetical protein